MAGITCAFAGTPSDMPGSEEALERLMSGNKRYTADACEHPNLNHARREETAGGQHPFAIILACADSRVAPELAFDQGIGDLFVVRVAGNVIDNVALGSIEYAVEHIGTPLIMVLGHEKCGAVSATVAGGHAPGHIHSIVEAIAPCVAEAKKLPGDLVDNSVRTNAASVAENLRNSAPLLREFVASGKLKVVAARYDLDTGAVELLP